MLAGARAVRATHREPASRWPGCPVVSLPSVIQETRKGLRSSTRRPRSRRSSRASSKANSTISWSSTRAVAAAGASRPPCSPRAAYLTAGRRVPARRGGQRIPGATPSGQIGSDHVTSGGGRDSRDGEGGRVDRQDQATRPAGQQISRGAVRAGAEREPSVERQPAADVAADQLAEDPFDQGGPGQGDGDGSGQVADQRAEAHADRRERRVPRY